MTQNNHLDAWARRTNAYRINSSSLTPRCNPKAHTDASLPNLGGLVNFLIAAKVFYEFEIVGNAKVMTWMVFHPNAHSYASLPNLGGLLNLVCFSILRRSTKQGLTA